MENEHGRFLFEKATKESEIALKNDKIQELKDLQKVLDQRSLELHEEEVKTAKLRDEVARLEQEEERLQEKINTKEEELADLAASLTA